MKLVSLRLILPQVNVIKTPKQQLEKVLEEAEEVRVEIDAGNRELQLLESVDLLVASANVLYQAGYTDREIYGAINSVTAKIKSRGKLKYEQRGLL